MDLEPSFNILGKPDEKKQFFDLLVIFSYRNISQIALTGNMKTF